jgi:hypothetical protein
MWSPSRLISRSRWSLEFAPSGETVEMAVWSTIDATIAPTMVHTSVDA